MVFVSLYKVYKNSTCNYLTKNNAINIDINYR